MKLIFFFLVCIPNIGFCLEHIRCPQLLDAELSTLGMGSINSSTSSVTRFPYEKSSASTKFLSKINSTHVTYYDYDSENLSGMGSIVVSEIDSLGNTISKKIFITQSCEVRKIIIKDLENQNGLEIQSRFCQKAPIRFVKICDMYKRLFSDRAAVDFKTPAVAPSVK